MELFGQVLVERTADRPARVMLARCSEFLAAPPGKDWEATNAMKVK
jgi:adenylate cyclase